MDAFFFKSKCITIERLFFAWRRIKNNCYTIATRLVSDTEQAELIKISVKMSRLMKYSKNKFNKIGNKIKWA